MYPRLATTYIIDRRSKTKNDDPFPDYTRPICNFRFCFSRKSGVIQAYNSETRQNFIPAKNLLPAAPMCDRDSMRGCACSSTRGISKSNTTTPLPYSSHAWGYLLPNANLYNLSTVSLAETQNNFCAVLETPRLQHKGHTAVAAP